MYIYVHVHVKQRIYARARGRMRAAPARQTHWLRVLVPTAAAVAAAAAAPASLLIAAAVVTAPVTIVTLIAPALTARLRRLAVAAPLSEQARRPYSKHDLTIQK